MKKTNKTFKRFAAITSASLLAACAMAPVFTSMTSYAATGTGSITVNETAGITSAIKAYQIFTADVDGDTVTITNWGNGIDVAKLAELVAADTTVVGKTTAEPPADITFSSLFSGISFTTDTTNNANVESAQAVAKVLSDNTSNTIFAETFAKLAAQCISGEGKAAVSNVISNLDYGYYVAVDTEAVNNGDGYTSKSLGILKVLSANAVEITPKRDYPSFDKQILDKNDSTDTATTPEDWGEAADHDIKDDVSFKLTATVPDNIGKYDIYKMVFHDDLQADVFTLKSDTIKVYVGDSEITTGFTTNTTATSNSKFNDATKTDGNTDFTVTFDNIKGIADPGETITIVYDATLTDKAKLGSTGNWNGAYLEYSNNPNVSGTGATGDENETANSPVDYVVAFTYQTIIDKINGTSQQPLPGAKFSLQKVKEGTTSADIDDGEIAAEKKIGNALTYTLCNGGSTFEFKGLDDGTYVLMETETPNSSYTAIEPIIFTVTATEKEDDGSEALTSLTVTEGLGLSTTNVYTITESDGKFTASAGANNIGAVYGEIANTQGSTLPGTGGIGTTIFYLGGGAMAAIGGIYLISKRRMKKSEE